MSVESHKKVRVVNHDGRKQRQQVIKHNPSTQSILVARISNLLWLIGGIVTGLIAFRFVLKLIAANPQNAFTNFIYDVTSVFISPFVGLTTTPTTETGSQFELISLIAIVVYAVVTWIIIILFKTIFADTGSTKQVTTIEEFDA